MVPSAQRLAAIVAAVLLVVFGASGPVLAEDTSSATTTTTSSDSSTATTGSDTTLLTGTTVTTLPVTTSTTDLGSDASSSTTQATTSTTSNGPTTTSTGPTTTGTGDSVPDQDTTVPEGEQSEEDTGEDPFASEAPTETVPESDVTVPEDTDGINSSGRYANQAEFATPEVLWSSVQDAEKKVSAAKTAHELAIARVKSLRLRQKELSATTVGLDTNTQNTLVLLQEAEERIRLRALTAFVQGSDAALATNLDYDNVVEVQVQETLVDSVLRVDRGTVLSYEALRDSLETETLQTHDRFTLVSDLLVDFEADVISFRSAIEQAERELETFAAGSPIYIEGIVFPIADLQYEVPMIDSYGFPRMLGSEDEHWHEGIDIFAPMGAPLVATERGIILRVGDSKLGGKTLWLRGESGTDWYYAHLSGFATGLGKGQVVEVGDLLGFVGTSGNAVGTPPHLHMQVHPGGADAINPYPMLYVVSQRDIELDAQERSDRERESEQRKFQEDREGLVPLEESDEIDPATNGVDPDVGGTDLDPESIVTTPEPSSGDLPD